MHAKTGQTNASYLQLQRNCTQLQVSLQFVER
jgi:hypothetical protein